MISVLAVLLASMAMVNGQPGMPQMPNIGAAPAIGQGMPGMPGQGFGQGAAAAAPAQQTSTNAMNVGPSVFSQEQIAQVQQDYARRIGMDPRVAQQLDSQLMTDIATQRTGTNGAGAAAAQQGFRAMQMNADVPLNNFGAARQAQAPLAQTYTNQQLNPYNPLAQNPLGQNPLGQNPYGQNPLGQNPLGQNPLGQNPLGNMGYPGAAATANNNMIMGVDRNFLQQLLNQPQMQQYQRSLTDMGYQTNAQMNAQPIMNTQQMASAQPMMTTQQMASPYMTQQMDSPYSIQQMAMPGMMPNSFMNPTVNYPNVNVQASQQSMNDVNTGFSNLLSGIGQGMTQAGRNLATGPQQIMPSEAIPTQGNLFATIPGVGRIDLGIPRVVPAGQNARVQAVSTSPQSGSVNTPVRTQIPQAQDA